MLAEFGENSPIISKLSPPNIWMNSSDSWKERTPACPRCNALSLKLWLDCSCSICSSVSNCVGGIVGSHPVLQGASNAVIHPGLMCLKRPSAAHILGLSRIYYISIFMYQKWCLHCLAFHCIRQNLIGHFLIQSWNCTLQKEAQKSADRCIFAHSPDLSDKSENVGYFAHSNLEKSERLI